MEGYEAVNNLITYTSKLFTVTYPDDGMNFIASSFAAKVNYKGGDTVIDADWDNDGKIDIANTIFSGTEFSFPDIKPQVLTSPLQIYLFF